MKKLVIVESPSKSKTIEKYLGNDYKVVSSKGHIRDLATTGKYGLGVDIENNFTPTYVPISGKKKLITDLKKMSKDYDKVVLATDPDREGEAISWHLYDALGLKDKDYERVTFHEITKDVIKEAFENPGKIDNNLVKSQETRRILDRIIGFRLSKLMQSKTGGKSAGRVQSVALKLIVDREREIEAFIPEEYHTITASFEGFTADLIKYQDKDIKIKNFDEAQAILDKLTKEFTVTNIDKKEKNRKSKLPFKTSTLQQVAVNKLGFSSSKTMRIAQKLYEGVDVGKETVGLITYMRTDSTRLSPAFIAETFKYIKDNYGEGYVGSVKKEKKTEHEQDAHEGIRPTSIYRTPESVKKSLTSEEYKLYSLIYYRTLASLMKDAKVMATSVDLINNDYLFRANGSVLIFDGYLKVYEHYEDNEDVVLPDLDSKLNQVIIASDITSEQHFTKPAPRYTESSLIKELEKLGIGRPSTYATIIETLKSRDYVAVEDKKFVPTAMGIETTDKLQEFFRDFAPLVDTAFKNMEKKEAELTGEKCPECGNDLVIRSGRYGKFIACSNYPNCKYIKKEEAQVIEVAPCHKCGSVIVERKTRKGKVFYGCKNYPKCDAAFWYLPIDKDCPKCGHQMMLKNKKEICPECDKKEQ